MDSASTEGEVAPPLWFIASRTITGPSHDMQLLEMIFAPKRFKFKVNTEPALAWHINRNWETLPAGF